jgi:hypothetical protein
MKVAMLSLSLIALIAESCPLQAQSFFLSLPLPRQRAAAPANAGTPILATNSRTPASQDTWSSVESPYSPIHYDTPATPSAKLPKLAPVPPAPAPQEPKRPQYLPSSESPGK